MYERFTDRARQVMELARKQAKRQRHAYFGTEHVLWALAEEGEGVAGSLLKRWGVKAAGIESEAEKLTGANSEKSSLRRPPSTPSLKALIERALAECRGLSHNYVGTEHLLLAIAADGETIAARVLENLGLDLGQVRNEVLSLLGHQSECEPEG